MAKWENNVRRVEPYTPGEQPVKERIIKLNTNENPYPPSPHVTEAVRALEPKAFTRYPDPNASKLRNAIAEKYGFDNDQIFVGVGSDDVLAMSFLTFFASGRPILFPDITYSFYKVWADLFRIPYEEKPLDGRFCVENRSYYAENGGIVLANPNAPTGILMDLSQVEDIVSRNRDVVVIVDEAYIDFVISPDSKGVQRHPQSAMNLIEKYENLLVVQTFSKSRSMAGMRIGFAAGNPKLIRFLNDAKFSFNSYTMNSAAIAAGTAAIKDDDWFRQGIRKITRTRERVEHELRKLGFFSTNSEANFLFVCHPDIPARDLFEELREEGIFVRYFDLPRIDQFLRITIGTDGQMDELLAFLRKRVTL